MSELAVRQDESKVSLVHPQTGELLDLNSAEADEIARWIESVREWEANARAAKQLASEELLRRMDQAASWTLRAGDYELKGESPNRVEYAIEDLRGTLTNLVASGAITEEAAEAAVKVETTYKPAKRGINALLKLGGDVAEAVSAAARPVERPRRVTVGRRR